MQYQVLARKYRPRQFTDVVGQPHAVQALSNALTQNKLHHAYLFTGTRGIGKTTLARLLAKCLSCEAGITATPCDQCTSCQEIDTGRFPDFYEIDAASRTKVEDTRELLDNVQYAPAKGRYKIYLIDEVHMLSGHSFNALLKTLEEPPTHVKFLLATTEQQKLPATILSRCLQFHLPPTTEPQLTQHLAHILQKEHLPFDASALKHISKAAHGSIRDALSLLDQCIAFGNGKVLETDVKTLLGTIEPTTLYEILHALSEHDGASLIQQIEKLNQQGTNFINLLTDLLSLLHEINVLQIVPDICSNTDYATLHALAQRITAEDIQLFYQIGIVGQRDFAFAPNPKIAFEMTLLRMLAFYPATKTNVAPKPAPMISNKKTTPIDDEWATIVSNLKLSGAALALAQNCNFTPINDSQVALVIKTSQQALAQPKQVHRIQQALTDYLQRPIKVRIDINDASQQSTPAALIQQDHLQRQQVAKQTLTADPRVQQFMQTFDATLIEDSITTDNNSIE